jgi:hypothetical protein
MSLEELVTKYIASAEHVFKTLRIANYCVNPEADDVEKVVASAKAYLEDAKYYRDKRELEVSLTSIAYCEGLLDALKLLGTVRFEWPAKAKLAKRER